MINMLLKYPGFYQELPPWTFCDEDLFAGYSFRMHQRDSISVNSYLAPALNFKLPVWGARLMGIPKDDIAPYLVNARFLYSGLLSSLSIFVLYLLSMRLFKIRSIALLASTLFSVSPFVLANSRFFYADNYLIFFSSLCLLSILKLYQEERSLKNYLAVGAMMGLVCSSKYTGIFFILPFTMAHLLKNQFKIRDYKNWFKALITKIDNLIYGVLLFLAVFFAINDAALVNFNNFLTDFAWNSKNYSSMKEGMIPINGHLFYLQVLFFLPAGLLIGINLFFTMIKNVKNFSEYHLMYLSMPVFLILAVGKYPNVFNRNMMILVPFILPYFAYALWQTATTLTSKITHDANFKMSLNILVIVIFMATPLFKVFKSVKSDLARDSRILAKEWLTQNLSSGESIGGFKGCTYDSAANIESLNFRPLGVPPELNTGECLNYILGDERVLDAYHQHWSYFYTNPYLYNFHYTNPGLTKFPYHREKLLAFLADYEIVKQFRGYGPRMDLYKKKSVCQ